MQIVINTLTLFIKKKIFLILFYLNKIYDILCIYCIFKVSAFERHTGICTFTCVTNIFRTFDKFLSLQVTLFSALSSIADHYLYIITAVICEALKRILRYNFTRYANAQSWHISRTYVVAKFINHVLLYYKERGRAVEREREREREANRIYLTYYINKTVSLRKQINWWRKFFSIKINTYRISNAK